MCTRTMLALRARDHGNRLTFVPCQSTGGVGRFGIATEDCAASIWAITPDGARFPGSGAAVLIASVLMQKRWPVAVGYFPGIRQALFHGYRLIARHRARFPGVTPWCEAHPEDCI